MKKCCSKTLLNEWKTFLKENTEFTKEVYKVGQKVRVEICCDGCGEAVTPTLNDMKKGKVFSGIVVEGDGWYLQIENELPQLMQKESIFKIPKETWHRIINKNGTNLIINVRKYK